MLGPMKLLLIEDDAGDAELVTRLLAKSPHSRFEATWTPTIEEGLAALASDSFAVVLLDLGLPGVNGLDGFVQVQPATSRAPIVVITDLNVEAVALRALHHGAQDYLIKGALTTDNLVRSMQYATERHGLLRNVAEARTLLEKKNRRLAKLYRTAHQFVDNVSHEFRTPLTVIKEYVSIIKDGIVGPVAEEQSQMLAIVEDRADELNTMVDDMLDVSKLEAGMLGVYRKQCDAAEIIDRVRPSLTSKAVVKKVDLQWDIQDDVPTLFCDPEKAARVIINLTINAIKFCGQPGLVRLTVANDPDRPGAIIRVTDNGPGISPENQQAIFRRFKQLSESVRSSTKGFGLGLSIARELVTANLGEIMLDSEVGRGSTFSFTLPAAEHEEVLRRYLDRIEQTRNGPADVTVIEAHIADASTDDAGNDADQFLSCLLHYDDLLLRISQTHWLIFFADAETEIGRFRERAKKASADAGRNRLGEPLAPLVYGEAESYSSSDQTRLLARLGSQSTAAGLVGA